MIMPTSSLLSKVSVALKACFEAVIQQDALQIVLIMGCNTSDSC